MFHFGIPFLVLLSRRVKRRAQYLSAVAPVVFVVHLVDVFWLNIVAPVGLGGLWLALFFWQLSRRSLLPWHELRLQEVVPHG